MVYTLYDTDTVPGSVGVTSGQLATLAKENVADLISNLFPLDYPLQQYLSKVPMTQPWLELPVDTFGQITRTAASVGMSSADVPDDDTVRVEGHTPTDLTDEYEHKLRAVSEIHVESFSVSGTARQASFYGITDPYTYKAFKTTEKVASDFELRFWHGRGTTPGGGVIVDFGAGTLDAEGIGANTFPNPTGNPLYARQTQGLFSLIVRSGLNRTLGSATIYNAHGEILKSSTIGNYCSQAYNLNGQNLTRDNFRYRLMQPWNSIGGRPDGCVMFMGGRVKGMFADFAMSVNGQVNTRNIPADSKTIVDTVDVYQTEYGIHYVNYCRYLDLAQTSAFELSDNSTTTSVAWDESLVAIMPQYFNIGVYRGIGYTPLARVGDKDQGMIVGEMGLICKNPIAGAALVNCVA